MQYSRTNQGGSVLGFVVVGVVLAAMVVGGVFLLRQRGEQARTSQPTVAQTDTDKQTPAPSSSDKDKKPATNNNSSQNKTSDKPATSNQSTGNQMPATGQSAPPAAEQQAGTKPNTASGSPLDHSDKLPVTGPFDTVFQLFAMGTLTAVTIAYIRSRLQATPSL